MNRVAVIAAAASTIVIAAISGCSDKKHESTGADHTSKTTTSATSAESTTSAEAAPGAPGVKVLIDGKDQNVAGTVVCTEAAGQINIAVGGSASGIAAVLTDADPPGVTSVALGNVDGNALGYTKGTGSGDATATKNGSSYKITGTATGADMKNPMQVVEKPFEIDVTCP